MSFRRAFRSSSAALRVLALRSLARGTAGVLAVSASIAAAGPAAPPDAHADSRAATHEWAVNVGETVRQAIEQAHEAAAAAVADVSRTLAQIDFDDMIADTAALAFIGNDLGGTRDVVKNAPYSAEAVTEFIQVLSDGNRIVRRSTTLLARDRFGRTRQEQRGERGTTTYISDPIDGKSYALNADRKTAVRIPRAPRAPMGALPPDAPIPPIPPTPPTPPAPPLPPDMQPPRSGPGAPPAPSARRGSDVEVQPGRVVVRRGADGAADGDDVRIEVVRVDGDRASNAMPPLHLPGLPMTPRGKGETKDLGTRDFDGIKADGKQTTHTIPAGAIGNEKPIVVSTERWFSPELHVVVFAKTTDPRAGETIYRLVNVKRGEPSPELFRVPDDYRIRGERKAK